jgi:hypothetical protein
LPTETLPFVDRHCIQVDSAASDTWRAIDQVMHSGYGGTGTAALAVVLGSEVRGATGASLTPGSTIVGFTVIESEPGRTVLFAGRHRFSRYSLRLDIEGRELCATTHAAFPGIRGGFYKVVLLRTGAHPFAMKRLLGRIKRRAEAGS